MAQIRIFARAEAIDAGHGEYALNITGKILKFFEKYYNASYPLSKSGENPDSFPILCYDGGVYAT